LFLLIYSISYCYLLLPHVKYFVLDDDSNLSNKVSSIKKNIYDTVGFHYKDLISIQDMKRGVIILKLSGPDKQVGCSRFIERSLEVINKPLRQRTSRSTLTTRERERGKKVPRTRSRSRTRESGKQTPRSRESEKHKERSSSRESRRQRPRSRESEKHKERSSSRESGKQRHSSRESEKHKERSSSRESGKQRHRSRSREKERHKERKREL
jgi:hypothetical protein